MAFKARSNLGVGGSAQERLLLGSPRPPLALRAMAQSEFKAAGLDAGWIAAKPFRDLHISRCTQQGILFRSKVSPAGLGHPDIKPEAPVFHRTECAPYFFRNFIIIEQCLSGSDTKLPPVVSDAAILNSRPTISSGQMCQPDRHALNWLKSASSPADHARRIIWRIPRVLLRARMFSRVRLSWPAAGRGQACEPRGPHILTSTASVVRPAAGRRRFYISPCDGARL